MHIDTIKDTFFLGKVGRCEWETGGDCASIHVAANLKLIRALWHCAIHALLLLRGGNFTEDHLLAKNVFDFVLDELEFVERIGVDGNI